jgi:tetratricopeptide (TPR) repeat protein
VVRGEEQDLINTQYLYTAAQDWIEIEGDNAETLLKITTYEYKLKRTVSLLQLAISGLEKTLENDVLQHVEEILVSGLSSNKVLDQLLVAPLAEPSSTSTLAKSALSNGLSTVAAILDELMELQPILNRLTDLWLCLEESSFIDIVESREVIWATIVNKCEMNRLLKAANKQEFKAKWNLLAFHFTTPKTRSEVCKIGEELSRRLFPGCSEEEIIKEDITEEAIPAHSNQLEPVIKSRKVYEKVRKQIIAIAQAVSEGRDSRAEKFLRQLVQEQISFSGGEDYAVKSLCNIAQQCADMFRMDFEAICLKEALRLQSYDPWTLIQYGDHLKRLGKYDEALKFFKEAEQFGEGDIAKSSIADVYSQQSEYKIALQIYESIPDWEYKPEVRTAIADTFRKIGRMDEAEAAYNELIHLSQEGLSEFNESAVRAHAGIAEIAKTKGRLNDALQIYREILEQEEIDDRHRVFYKLGLCNILKLMEKFDDAYSVADEVVQEYPFAMQARFIRGSILGLIGRELEGLKDLPESKSSRSWREWLRYYYRGLLLFKLKRYEDAKKNLVEEFPKAIASGEEKAILRMAAALCFLREDEIYEADGILSEVHELHDYHAKYLSLVLKMHSAARKEDLAAMHFLKEQIVGLKLKDSRLDKAIIALDERNFSLATECEIIALLKLAA